jgi:cobalamin synthase
VPDRDEWMKRLGPVYPGLVALARTTSLVAPDVPHEDEGDVGRAAVWVVVVGAVIGIGGWIVVRSLAGLGATPALAGLVAAVAMTLVGGGVAERGFARWIGGPKSTRTASNELLAIGGATLVRWVALVSTSPGRWAALLIAAPLAGRWSAVFLQAIGDPAPVDRGRRSLIVVPPAAAVTGALTLAIAGAAVYGLGWTGLVAIGIAAGLAFAMGLRSQRKHGGIDGDVVAAAAVIGELVVWIAVALQYPTAISPWQR